VYGSPALSWPESDSAYELLGWCEDCSRVSLCGPQAFVFRPVRRYHALRRLGSGRSCFHALRAWCRRQCLPLDLVLRLHPFALWRQALHERRRLNLAHASQPYVPPLSLDRLRVQTSRWIAQHSQAEGLERGRGP
jgi:hypothetical protein